MLRSPSTLAAFVQSSGSCPSSAGSFCNVGRYLHGLHVLAVILAVILVVVLIATVGYFRRARRMKIEP